MNFWGKLHRFSSGETDELELTHHCIDVACVFRALCALPAISRGLVKFLPHANANANANANEIILDRLAVFALLHDLGKCNTGFQARRDPNAVNTAGHVIETSALFCDEDLSAKSDIALGLNELVSWFDSQDGLYRMLLAALFHHGKPAYTDDICNSNEIDRVKHHWKLRNGIDPFVGLGELGATARRTFPSAFKGNAPPIPVTIELEHRFAGLVMLADWLGSHREAFFPFKHEGNRIEWSRHQARKALAAVGLDISAARSRIIRGGAPTFRDTFGISGEPRPLQSALASAELPPLLIAESDTGSGKTEGALMHFLALFSAGMVDGLYFALPTRVAARELYGRINATMKQVFGDDCPPVLLAVPGYAQIDGERTGNILPTSAHLFHDEDQIKRDRAWAAERPKRFLAAPIAVGTIDQVLLSSIQVPHAHLRATCLDRSLLVVDEVHSSDIYMRYLCRRVLARHLAGGGRALLLSATLGSAARAEYLSPGSRPSVPESFDLAACQPYPALCAPGMDLRHLPDPAARSKRVRIQPLAILESPDSLLPELRAAVAAGRRVMLVLNTVARALTLARLADADPALAPALFSVNGQPCPHHGRFARSDRELLDAEVSKRMGKGSPAGTILLIGTQTLEQSLDIDADWLITDLCPMDVLLQRIGRLHRHDRGTRPTAVCSVLLPEQPDFSAFLKNNGEMGRGSPAGFGFVYEDLRILQLTRDWAATHPEIEIPRDNRRLVESATHPERLSTLTGAKWQAHAGRLEGGGLAKTMAADNALIPVKHFGDFLFPRGLEAHLTTRLGLNDRTVSLGGNYASPFGQVIDEINIPGHLAPGLAVEQAHLVSLTENSLHIHIGPLVFRYSRFGLEKLDESAT